MAVGIIGGIYSRGGGPGFIAGATFLGTWDANANLPNITSGVGNNGDFYLVDTAGTTTVDGESVWAVGDIIIFDGASGTWKRVAGSNLWQSGVNGIDSIGQNIGIGSPATAVDQISSIGIGVRSLVMQSTDNQSLIRSVGATGGLIEASDGGTSSVTAVASPISGSSLNVGSTAGLNSVISIDGDSADSHYLKIGQGVSPLAVIDSLYNVGGELYWNGYQLTPPGATLWQSDVNGINSIGQNIGVGSPATLTDVISSIGTGTRNQTLSSTDSSSVLTINAATQALLNITSTTEGSSIVGLLSTGGAASFTVTPKTGEQGVFNIGDTVNADYKVTTDDDVLIEMDGDELTELITTTTASTRSQATGTNTIVSNTNAGGSSITIDGAISNLVQIGSTTPGAESVLQLHPSTVPSSTTNRLYNLAGDLYWNGVKLN